MSTIKTAPYGAWKSPITADLIVGETIGLDQIVLDGDDAYWIERRPAEAGRQVIVRHNGAGVADVIPTPFSARSRVHEYGGGAYTVHRYTIYFVNDSDQGLYVHAPGASPRALYCGEGLRLADLVIDSVHNRLICVCEDHSKGGAPENRLMAISLSAGAAPKTLSAGRDFYASPTLSPDGKKLAWLCWNHPDMPWDGSELWLAEIQADGTLTNGCCVAGSRAESVFQPQWSPDGRLYFVSDRNGWWNICRLDNNKLEVVAGCEAEFGLPQWVFGMSTYGFQSQERILCTYSQEGTWNLASLCVATGELERIDVPYTDISGIRVAGGRAVFLAGSPTTLPEIITLDLHTKQHQALKQSSVLQPDAGYLSAPRAIAFPTRDTRTAHGFFYAAKNRDYVGPADTRPPLIVCSHGGPTAAVSSGLNLKVQYWTSRGFAVLDVNYGGSTGYGRAYRERLNGQWGVVDVEDCINGARFLVAEGLVDGDRLIIRGGSAGGYTTLCALTFTDVFKAGASLYGIGDLEALAHDTHKFESHYLERLIGPYPQQRQRYHARSPLRHAAQLSCPVIFLQGLEDKVVPPNQAEAMVDALKKKGIPVAYVPFAGEQHGFRQAANIKHALEAELYFYSRVFGIDLANDIAPVEIANLFDAET